MMSGDQTPYWERPLARIGRTGVPGAHRLINALAPRYGEAHRFCTKFGDLAYAGDLSQMIDRSIFYFGSYSPAELEFFAICAAILSSLGREVNFFDIGANTGQHSLHLCRKVASIHAFEPSLRVADQFRSNFKLNCLSNIRIHTVGLADADASGEARDFPATPARGRSTGPCPDSRPRLSSFARRTRILTRMGSPASICSSSTSKATKAKC